MWKPTQRKKLLKKYGRKLSGSLAKREATVLPVGAIIKWTADWVLRLRRDSEVYFDRRSQSEIRSTKERDKSKCQNFR